MKQKRGKPQTDGGGHGFTRKASSQSNISVEACADPLV